MTINICCISDLHEQWFGVKIPKCDLLIVAGDLTYRGDFQMIKEFNSWAARLQDDEVVDDVVVIAGNHDITAQTNPEEFRKLLPDVSYLCDEAYEFRGLKIYGAPWSPSFFKEHWVFNADRGEEISAKWAAIPEDTNILVIHGPPYGCGDLCDDGRRVGCVDLGKRLVELSKLSNLKLVVCGHIHNDHGKHFHLQSGVPVINASTCTERYKPTNVPILFSIEENIK